MAKRYTLTTQNRAGFTAHVGSIPTPGTMLKKIELEEKDIQKLFHKDTPTKRFLRVIKKTIKQVVFLVFLFIVFYYTINFSAFWDRFNYSIHSKPSNDFITLRPSPTVTVNYSPSIEIPAISVKAPMTMNVGSNDITAQLKNGVTHYKNSALPGQVGNMVIVGHSSDFVWSDGKFKTVFTLLDKLKVGDSIIIPYQASIYKYQVISTKIVKPEEVSVLAKTNEPIVTLITCYPVGTTQKRFIVTARLVEGPVSGVQTTDPLTESLPTPR